MSQITKTADAALATLDRLAQASAETEFVASARSALAKAGATDKVCEYVIKHARTFEECLTISTEDLVKRALERILGKGSKDKALAGIKQASLDNERAEAMAALNLAEGFEPKTWDDNAELVPVMFELAKRASGLGKGANYLKMLQGVASKPGRLSGAWNWAKNLASRGGGAASEGAAGAKGLASRGAAGAKDLASRGAGRLGLGEFARTSPGLALGGAAGAGALGAQGLPAAYNWMTEKDPPFSPEAMKLLRASGDPSMMLQATMMNMQGKEGWGPEMMQMLTQLAAMARQKQWRRPNDYYQRYAGAGNYGG